MATINEVTNAFEHLYQAMYDHKFIKKSGFRDKGEKSLLPLVRYYLLGYFGKLEPELKIQMEECQSGYIDFLIDKIAVEFAVKTQKQRRTNLQRNQNETEIKKLMLYEGRSILVLFDFSENVEDDVVSQLLENYRILPAIHQGKDIYPFNVVYFYINQDNCFKKQQIQVRVN